MNDLVRANVIFQAEHRIQPWKNAWSADSGLLMLTQRERIRRWRYVWLIDMDQGTSRLWFDLNEVSTGRIEYRICFFVGLMEQVLSLIFRYWKRTMKTVNISLLVTKDNKNTDII